MIFAVYDGNYGEEFITLGDTIEEAYSNIVDLSGESNPNRVLFYKAENLNVRVDVNPTFTIL